MFYVTQLNEDFSIYFPYLLFSVDKLIETSKERQTQKTESASNKQYKAG